MTTPATPPAPPPDPDRHSVHLYTAIADTIWWLTERNHHMVGSGFHSAHRALVMQFAPTAAHPGQEPRTVRIGCALVWDGERITVSPPEAEL